MELLNLIDETQSSSDETQKRLRFGVTKWRRFAFKGIGLRAHVDLNLKN